jgi:hypothetical protein
MRKLISRLVFPLTFLSYVLFDKWWYVDVADGPDIVVHGFPIISNAPSLASSMEKIYFVPETLINITAYFAFWLLIVFILKLWIGHIKIPSVVTKISSGIILLSIVIFIYFSLTFNSVFRGRMTWIQPLWKAALNGAGKILPLPTTTNIILY